MITFWFFVFVAVALLDRAHRSAIEERVERHAFRLYALRDELREAAMNGEVRPSNWVFEYLDSSIAKTIAVLPSFTIWSLIFVAFTRRDDERVSKARYFLDQQLEKPANAFLRQIHTRYYEAIGAYLLDRHLSVRILVSSVLAIRRRWRKALELSTEAPETSTLPEYVAA